jgi:hypothetical protein
LYKSCGDPNFREHLSEARFEIDCQLLRDTQMTIGNLAQMLG